MKYLKVWTSFRDVMEPLSDAEKGRLFDAMLVYAEQFEEPETFAGNERFVWPAARQLIDLTYSESVRLAENGKKGGRPKTNRNQPKPTETNENQPEPTETHKEKEWNGKKRKGKENKVNILFDRFWAAYPRHEAKQAALRAFEKLNPDENLLGTILDAVEVQKKSDQWTRDNGQFIPHPATWINQRRWEDETLPAIKVLPRKNYESQRDYAGSTGEVMQRMIRDMGEA